ETPDDEDLRSVLFLTFDGEEMGLKGSRYFSDNPAIDPAKTSLLLNMDMIGRLRGGNISVLGTATAEDLPELLRPHFEASGLTVAVTEAGSGRSDDANFHRLGVPGMHFFTGMHKEYTSPADQAWTVNPAGAKQVLDLLYAIALDVASRPEKLVYQEAAPGRGRDRGYAPVRLGIRPGMGDQIETGILVDQVYEHTSASEGGLLPGDIMIQWNRTKLEGPGDLFQMLQQHSPGDMVTIIVLREGQQADLLVTLKAGRPRPDR
ncbi:MAG: M28 family peptidase, partial [Planctomycetota bacterium]